MLSLIIPVYNDWIPLDRCLRSVASQAIDSGFEVIVVDDGSQLPAPEEIRGWMAHYPLTLVRQSHAGISAARNHGLRISQQSTVLFVDADCELEPGCLAAVDSAISSFPQHHYFQIRLVGNSATLVGRAEQLRLTALQSHLLQPDGRIRYLNTAGFAIRRSQLDRETGLFDPDALRAEDTLLLGNLMQNGDLPLFVPNAVIQHAIPLTLGECFAKDIRSAYLERRTYERVAAQGLKIRISNWGRLQILARMWKISRDPAIGRLAWFVLTARQALQRTVSLLSAYLPYPKSPASNGKAIV